jgi:hypothetical protein
MCFFDGVNDSIVNCQSVNGPNGHGQVRHIRKLISNEKNFFKGLYVRGLEKFKRTNTFTVLNGIGKRIGLQDLKRMMILRTTLAIKVNMLLKLQKV